MRTLDYDGFVAGALAPAVDKVRAALERDDFRSADVKKLAAGTRLPLYRAKLNDADRLIFTTVSHGGATCAPALSESIEKICVSSGFSHVVNGRFKGGWTTRHYGRPDHNVHAVQMELAQSAYLEAEVPPWTYSETKATRLRDVLAGVLTALHRLVLEMKPHG